MIRCFLFCLVLGARCLAGELRAGAAAIDITPTEFPVIVNCGFTERTAHRAVDPLFVKALVLDDGPTRLAIVVVDSCVIPRALLDRAKELASERAGIPVERMLIAATHSHSSPSVLPALGARAQPEYTEWLPGKIAEGIVAAAQRLVPARVGWASVDDWEHTHCRRWIRRPDRMLADPFGAVNVRANMHPGHQSADVTGPSGPVDPQLSVLGVQSLDGRPLALFANYSQHYYGSPLLSSDYYGRFAKHIAAALGADSEFVGIMSQGTSGDQQWMDYGAPPHEIGYDAYAGEVAARALEAWKRIAWVENAPLAMSERRVTIPLRRPDEKRVAWAEAIVAKLGERLPQSMAEIYARGTMHLHTAKDSELRIQAVRIGELGIAGLAAEAYAITGLKIKAQSPLPATFAMTLANGVEGYIPPPEQHALGGYTTQPGGSNVLIPDAEPRIVETALACLEDVAKKPRRPLADAHGPAAKAVLDAKPAAFWRLDEIVIPTARDATGQHDATFEDGIALHLPGVGSGEKTLTPSPFSGERINRAPHFAGGRVRAKLSALGDHYSVSLWLWNALPHEARLVTGYVFSRGPDGDKACPGEHLGIGGSDGEPGRLFVFNGNAKYASLGGRSKLALKKWHHVVLVREGGKVRVHLDGNPEPEIAGDLERTLPAKADECFIGGRSDSFANFEGKLDEVAIYPRALIPEEIATHYKASGLTPPVAAVKPAPALESQPLSPLDSLKKIHVADGFGVEIVAAEPLTMDPVAIAWDAAVRLWVVEMADYPLGLDNKGQPGGRVRILDDTDGDGRLDKSTLFADALPFPAGLLPWRDGVLVAAAPDILFLRDTDGDGRADTRETLITGLLAGNQQLRANGLRWGLDGWVYVAAGGHHGEHGVGTKLRSHRAGAEVLVGSRDFRFRPDTSALEPASGPSQFGRNRDDWGRWFGTQNARPLWHYVLPDHYLRRNPHFAAPDPRQQLVVPLSPKVWPVSAPEKRFHSFNEAGHFTSACSGMIYRDELLFGKRARGELHAFTCEPFHNLVQHHVLAEAGVSFAARRAPGEERSEFFASEDRWCRPVMTRTGPDGALWVVDMYRYMIEHPDWLPAAGKTELLPHYRAGDERGRIYRVFKTGVPLRKPARLDQLSMPELVAALDSPNEWQRDTAHMLLLWRADAAAIPHLEKMAREHAIPLARVHALCALDELDAPRRGDIPVVLNPGGVPETAVPLPRHRTTGMSPLLGALRDPHAGIRENALRIAERHTTSEMIAAATQLADDPDAKVRLQLAFTLGEWKDPRAGEALARLAIRDHAEPFMLAAIMSSAVPHVHALASAPALAEPLARLARALGAEPAKPALPTASAIAAPAGRADIIAQFQPALKLPGDPARGREFFTQRCVACHQLGELGREVGPSLASVSAHPPEKLLANIIDPNADVQPGFYAYRCRLSDGMELHGLIAAETASSLTFKLVDGATRAVLRNEITALESTRASLMPAGLEAGLSHQGMADLIAFLRAGEARAETRAAALDMRIGAAAVNFKSDASMPLAGYLEARFTDEQEGELRAVALVVEKPGAAKVAIVACDVLWLTREIVDAAAAEIEKTTGIPATHLLVNATHTHHAPGTAPAHAFGWSPEFAGEVCRGIVRAVQDAHARLADAALFFHLGEERTVGANSRLLLGDGAVSWLNPMGEAGARVEPTGPFDPQLPVLDFRDAAGATRALLFNHSTHTIGTRSGRDVRSPSFYGLAAQELERELGGIVSFLEGASGSTHNIRSVPVPVAIERMKRAVLAARAHAQPRPIARLAALKRPFTFRVRTFDEAVEAERVARYTTAHAPGNAARIREIFAAQRRELAPKQGEERTTWVQVIALGDVAIVGIPAEYFTGLGLDIKRRSPFPHTIIAELANDWIGYLPDRAGHALGGYQTWTGLHSYAELGTGERLAEQALKLLGELHAL